MNEEFRKEQEKYISMYKLPGYKMGSARKNHATNCLESLKKGSLLDVGCGRGEMLDIAKKLGFSPVAGIDIVPSLVNARNDVIFGAANDIPFEDHSFDHIIILDVIEHLLERDIPKVFEELDRVSNKTIILCIANFPHISQGINLHITIKPYKEWDSILKEVYSEYEVVWLPRKNNISETWKIIK